MKQFKTPDDLQEHYWSVIVPMCRKYNAEHDTDVKTWECVRENLRPKAKWRDHPDFKWYVDAKIELTFALAILEGKPVFVGDEVYDKSNGTKWVVTESFEAWDHAAWAPPTPKRTFTLGGRTLPVPLKPDGKIRHTVKVLSGSYERHFDFETNEDAMCFSQGICDQVTEARDKK